MQDFHGLALIHRVNVALDTAAPGRLSIVGTPKHFPSWGTEVSRAEGAEKTTRIAPDWMIVNGDAGDPPPLNELNTTIIAWGDTKLKRPSRATDSGPLPGVISLTEDVIGDRIPRYAILSHRWGMEEVTFKDLMDGTGPSKQGYDKIRFCSDQAERDGLDHFWVDTCCIDKSSSAELTEAINSMFQWYRNAAKCYVYLDDVSKPAFQTGDEPNYQLWEPDLRKSKWFTRGWTLQELLAPASVEFFSREGARLGTKRSLELPISDITGIPLKVLRGSPILDCTVPERMAWAEPRQTTRDEDKAYSLLGIFDVQMPLIYGEGREKAFKRLQEEIDKALKGRLASSILTIIKSLTYTGIQHEDFSVTFSLSGVPEIEHFVAREQELAEMRETLNSDGSRRVVVLHGLGGIGKTQLAIAYAKWHKDSHSAVFWLNIKDENSLKHSFNMVAKRILREHPSASRLSSVDTENLDEVIDAVKAWLSLPNNTRWLLIYDNYDNPKLPSNKDPAALDIDDFLPESYQGSVIITTRSSQVKIGHPIRIRKMENVLDSIEILSNASNRQGLIHDADAVSLVRKLDGLPLALATAGAYLNQTSTSFGKYLRLYEDSWTRLQTTSPELSSYADRTLYSTWQLSLEHIKRRNEYSAELLRLWAYFDNQDIWLELIQHSNSEDPAWIREVAEDELSFNSTVRVLSDYGLVEVNTASGEQTESRGYSIHSCVHSWTMSVLNQEWDQDLAKLAVKCVASHIPGSESDKWWLIQRRLLQHAARCYYLLLNHMITNDGLDWAFHNLGLLYSDQGKLKEAEEMYQRALQGCEKALGPDHTLTLNTVNNLGSLYKDQGKLKEAEKMYQRALQGYEKALGPDHTSTLSTVNNLGILYKGQGKLKEAEEMYQRAMRGKEKALGPDHTSTLNTVNNLGILYNYQGKLKEAEEMCPS
ncbi:hypothetical protein DL762_007374 [Monosporascus cannonballus]|uniref:Heterokaryon incompatibility domain-containing protein n=1 Tax=Monosporascus cannonballus TaxID=155416 RepID=A0ABY0H0C1_9PEZI|nr:hypothetical protein DL762_007374 [Monosporascus cannonballus]